MGRFEMIGQVTAIPKGKTWVLEWKIKDLDSLSECAEQYYYSHVFSFGGESWKLVMYPNGEKYAQSVGCIDMYLYRESSGTPISMEFSFALKTVNGKKDIERHCAGIFYSLSCLYINKLISRFELRERKSEFLTSGFLTVVCTIKEFKSIGGVNGTNATGLSEVRNHDKILQDFKLAFQKEENCDVVLRVKGREFKAHKFILAARSPVFASTFRNNMKEKETGIVDIEDCDPSVFPEFLCFLYSDGVDSLSEENVFGLFIAADKYDVPDLRKLCLKFMKEKLTVETFCETLILALQHSQAELIQLATDFFIKHAEKILVTVKWQSFATENPTQSNELFIKFVTSDRCLKT